MIITLIIWKLILILVENSVCYNYARSSEEKKAHYLYFKE